jgi:hypothetical protein
MPYYTMDEYGEHNLGYAPYWKVKVEANFKDDKEAINYYMTNIYSPSKKTRLAHGNIVTHRSIETQIMYVDGKPVGSGSLDTTTIMIVVVIIIIITIAYFAMRKK